MIKITIEKKLLDFEFTPFKYKDAIIFLASTKDSKGLFGFKNNQPFFINHEKLDSTLEIEIPESIEENEELTQAAGWLVSRINSTGRIPLVNNPKELETEFKEWYYQALRNSLTDRKKRLAIESQ